MPTSTSFIPSAMSATAAFPDPSTSHAAGVAAAPSVVSSAVMATANTTSAVTKKTSSSSSSSSSSSPMASSSLAATVGSAAAAEAAAAAIPPLWDMDQKGLEKYVRATLFSGVVSQAIVVAQQEAAAAAVQAAAAAATSKPLSGSSSSRVPLVDPHLDPSHAVSILWSNLETALESLQHVDVPVSVTTTHASSASNPSSSSSSVSSHPRGPRVAATASSAQEWRPTKRPKMAAPRVRTKLSDPFAIWNIKEEPQQPAKNIGEGNDANDDDDDNVTPEDIPLTLGERLSQLTTGGLCNALAGVPKGIVFQSVPTARYMAQRIKAHDNTTAVSQPAAATTTTLANTTRGAIPSLALLWTITMAFHRSVQALLAEDSLRTTPSRIHHLLAADLEPSQLTAIRKRIVDTVLLGKGLHGNSDNDPNNNNTPGGNGDDDDGVATKATGSNIHDVDRFHKCPTCQNTDQAGFVLDRKNGDVICSTCGTVVSESLMHEGSQFRKFEGEQDRNHHGDSGNPLYSNAHNMGTSLSGSAATGFGAGMGGWGSQQGGGGKRNLETILRNAHAYTELNVSQFGKNDRRTRTGYKDQQKKQAFVQMTHAGDALGLHEAVVQRAKEIFASFRDDRELVQQFKGVIAACLCEAFQQLSAEGKLLLKQQQRQQLELAAQELAHGKKAISLSTRAVRRNELHHATLAGKGGTLLDFSNTVSREKEKSQVKADAAAALGNSAEADAKPAAAWDLEDCRSWLLEASRSIAQQWVEQRTKNAAMAKRLPTAPLEELEGELVNHSIKLCEELEKELIARRAKSTLAGNGASRITTPRVNMAKLGIKWQHSHERGSGGKGGVGGSGTTANKKDQGPTAGQILILKTSKKLGAILGDNRAGEAIHKELRGLVGKQTERKRKEMRDEASRQRMNQMQRKPWLQAKMGHREQH